MKFCSNCSKQFPETETLCPECGAELTAEEAQADEAMEAIARKYLQQLQKRTALLDVQLQLPQEFAHLLGQRCRDKGGARALRRLVQEEVEGPLATFLLRCSRRPEHIAARIEDGRICFQ